MHDSMLSVIKSARVINKDLSSLPCIDTRLFGTQLIISLISMQYFVWINRIRSRENDGSSMFLELRNALPRGKCKAQRRGPREKEVGMVEYQYLMW